MARPTKIKIQGKEKLQRQLSELPKKIMNKGIKGSLKDGAKIVAKEIKKDAPDDTGQLKGSVKVKVGPRKKGLLLYLVQVLSSHAAYIELGTRLKPAVPFMRPALKRKTKEVVDQVVKSLNAYLKKLNG